MKVRTWIVALVLVCLLATAGPVRAADSEYVLHPGDMLAINVFGYPELSFPSGGALEGIIIRPDGKIAYPFLGEIVVEGLTPKALVVFLKEQLSAYYTEPNVSVNVMRYSNAFNFTERVYVLGEVNQPGMYELDKSRNLLDAIGAAKGWTKNAAKTKVFLIRKDQKGEPMKINLMALLNKGDTSVNLPLRQGDVIFLTGNNRINFAQDVLPLVSAAYMITWMGNPNR